MAPRKLHNYIYATIANCCLYVTICSIALGTNKWYSGTTKEVVGDGVGTLQVEMSYGLFSGKKTKLGSGREEEYNLKIVCKGATGCMFSCGLSGEQRNLDIQNMANRLSESDPILCRDFESLAMQIDQTQANEKASPVFINLGLYVTTIMFIVLGEIFAIVAGIQAMYNTYRTAINPIFSVTGLYIWNGIAAGFAFLAMMMWIIEFFTRLQKNAAISDTLSGNYENGKASLGASFWILILPILLALANIATLRYRTWRILKTEENNIRVMKGDKIENGEILLF